MRHLLCTLALFAVTALNSLAFDLIPVPSDASMKQSLDGLWAFKYNDSSEWDSIPVPACWDALGYLPPRYAHPDDVHGLYKTTFTVPKTWKDKQVFVNFDGVLRGYGLWVNGQYAGRWELANNSCQFEITDYVKSGANELSVRVYTRYKGYEFDGNDDWGQVGIHRDVTLFAVPKSHVTDLTIVSKVPENDPVEVSFSMALSTKRAVVKGEIRNPQGEVESVFTCKTDSGTVRYLWHPAKPQLWTAETPSLYSLSYSVCQGNKRQESLCQKFGIREIRIDGHKLLLNNRLFKLRGVTTHATDPRNGKVISDALNLKDMRLMKQGNVNFIRNSHYPREPRFYDLCDSLGFYVMDEVPFGYGDEHLTDTSYQDNLLLRADATVARDKNHPCVIIWSVGNENNLTDICKVTGRHVQELDPSRPMCYPMIGSYFYRHHFDWPDFIDIFSPHYPSVETLKEYAEKSFKPLIATEYCHTLGQSFEQHHERWELMQANDNLAGGAIWEWVDQGMPSPGAVWPGKFGWTDKVWLSRTEAIQMEGNKGTDGLLYATRDPLPNYYGMRKNYAQAYILTDKVTTAENIDIDVENRYDFLDLKDKVTCHWQISCPTGGLLAEGDANLSCPPHQKCVLKIDAGAVLEELPRQLCLLTIIFNDKSNGLQVNEKTFVLNDGQQYAAIIDHLKEGLKGSLPFMDGKPYWRTGRKPSLAEEVTYNKPNGHFIRKYIMEGDCNEDGGWRFANDEITYTGQIEIKPCENGRQYDFDLAPQGENHLLTEAGMALLLDSCIRYFQWVGNGPYTAYPGKDNANEPGVHALQAGDLYFEGNKSGVDALLCTDAEGNGVLFVPYTRNVNLEETDKGVLVSFNPLVSGIGSKGSVTKFAHHVDDTPSVSGSVMAFPVKAGQWSEAMKHTFRKPSEIQIYAPFLSVYDTYLLKFDYLCE